MAAALDSRRLLAQEARTLLTRLETLRSFALHDTSVPAAAIGPKAQAAIERSMREARADVRGRVEEFIAWLETGPGRELPPHIAQRRFSIVRLRFNAALARFDIFADALTQRSEHRTGVWLSGLDALASEALALPGAYESPPVVCYLDRGAGAAIRRARTRLPGGGENPVAIIRVPRERMVGSGIASSLVHEVGHQAAALLDLVNSLRGAMRKQVAPAWRLWERWISEIAADFWSVARIGIGSTLGLMAVVSLPRPFVFRLNMNDPHPTPWLRVKISCAIGERLFQDPRWRRLAAIWQELYPLEGLPEDRRQLLQQLEAHLPALVGMLAEHRPAALGGRTLMSVLRLAERRPERLDAHWRSAAGDASRLGALSPSLAFATLGQAKFDGRLDARSESAVVGRLLTHWALEGAISTNERCARVMQTGARLSAA
jgi:hypothetical protein